MRILIKTLVGILAIAILALVIGPWLIDWNRFKPAVEARLEEAIGRDITLAGDLKVRLLPQPRLIANEVSLANVPEASTPDLLTLTALDLRLSIWRLLTGRIVVTSLKLSGPVLSVERMADGRFNLAWAHTPAPPQAIVPAGFTIVPERIAVSRIEIAAGRLEYRDRVLGWGETVDGINATGTMKDLAGPIRAAGHFSFGGHVWGLNGELSSDQGKGLRPLAAAFQQDEAGLKATWNGRLEPSTEKTPWRISGALAVRATRPTALWGAAPDEGTPVPALALNGALSAGPTEAGLKDAAMRWGDFVVNGSIQAAYAQQPSFSLQAKGGQLNIDVLMPAAARVAQVAYWPMGFLAATAPPAKQPPSVNQPSSRGLSDIWNGSVNIDLEGLVVAQGRLSNVRIGGTLTGHQFEIKEAVALLPGDTETHLAGVLVSDRSGIHYDGTAALAGTRARELFAWLGVPVQGLEEGRLTEVAYKGGLGFGPGDLRLHGFEAAIDGSQARGSFGLRLAPLARPQVNADLTITRINADAYRPLFEGGPSPLDTVLETLDGMDGTAKLAVDVVVSDGLDIRGLKLDLGLAPTGVAINRFEAADLLGLQLALAGQGSRFSAASTLDVTGTAVGLDMRPFLARLGVLPSAGRAPIGPFSIDLTARFADGSGTVTAEGPFAGANVLGKATLDKLAAPLRGQRGSAGSLRLDVGMQGPNMVALGRLMGFDPPGGAGLVVDPDRAVAAAQENHRLLLEPNPSAPPPPLPAGWLLLQMNLSDPSFDLGAKAGLPGGDVGLLLTRRGEGTGATYRIIAKGAAPDTAAILDSLGTFEARRASLTGPLALTLDGAGPAGAVQFKPVSLAIGSQRLQGEGSLNVAGERPVLGLNLNGTSLNLDDALGVFAGPPDPLDIAGRWSQKPLQLSRLDALDATVILDAETLTLGGLVFEKPHLQAALAGGTLTISEVRAALFGGPLTANAALRGGSAQPGFAASVKFIQTDAAKLSRALWGREILFGQVAGTLNLTTQGPTTMALAGAASGNLSLKSPAGTAPGIDPGNPDAITAFSDLVIEAPMTEGVARIETGRITLADGPATLDGFVALAPWRLKLSVVRAGNPSSVVLEGPMGAPHRRVE